MAGAAGDRALGRRGSGGGRRRRSSETGRVQESVRAVAEAHHAAHEPFPGFARSPGDRAAPQADRHRAVIRRLVAEALGTALLLAIVVGSGIMGERLAAGNAAVALLANTLATGAGLFVLITTFGPISGAHFNPAVTLAALIGRAISLTEAAAC